MLNTGQTKVDLNQVCYMDSYTVIHLQDRAHIDNCFPQAQDEMNIPENLCSDVTDSYSHTEEELSECETVIRGLFT